MAHNDEAGGSRALSEQEQARENNLEFWEFYSERGPAPDNLLLMDVDGGRDDTTDGAGDGDNTTGGAGDGNDTTDGAGDGNDTTDGSEAKKRRKKERSKNKVGTGKLVVTEVSICGKPVAPTGIAGSYGNQVAALLRENVSIYEDNIRNAGQEHLLVILLKKLHERYGFPKPFNNEDLNGNVVNNYAITKMSKALASWRSRVKTLIEKEASPEEIWKKERVNEEDLGIFKARLAHPAHQEMAKWGKWMRSQTVGNHHLGSGGYRAAEPKWSKEDEERRARGEENPYDKYKDKQTKNFIRARFGVDKQTKELKTDPAVVKFQEALVEVESASASSASSSQGSSQLKPYWDTTFNKAMNKVKGHDLTKPPSGGRVAGFGDTKWREHYAEERKERQKRPDDVLQEKVEDAVAKALTSLLPTMMQSITNWIEGGRKGPCPVPSLTGSNSINATPSPPVMVNPAVNTAPSPPAPPPNRDNLSAGAAQSPLDQQNTPAGIVPTSSHSHARRWRCINIGRAQRAQGN